MAEFITANERHLHQITQAQFEQQPEQHHLKHVIGRHLQKVEGRARALVETATTSLTAIGHIAESVVLESFLVLRDWQWGQLIFRTHRSKIVPDTLL